MVTGIMVEGVIGLGGVVLLLYRGKRAGILIVSIIALIVGIIGEKG